MTTIKHAPGTVRDAIVAHLDPIGGEASVAQITRAVEARIGAVPASSVRSYLRLRRDLFRRTRHGFYQLRRDHESATVAAGGPARRDVPPFVHGKAALHRDDCFDWLERREENSVHAVVTDPPYGLVEYTESEQRKLREGKGGVWRIPPSFDGHRRSPVPRFTTLSPADLEFMGAFFRRLGLGLSRVLVPGAHVFVASNPLVSHIVATALADSGLENRGTVTRLVMTMRGGDRPKNAHEEFSDVTVMPRSMAEPWLLFRNPLEGRVQDNLRKWGAGGLRRASERRPFGDVVESRPTRPAERRLAPHPSLKPQAFPSATGPRGAAAGERRDFSIPSPVPDRPSRRPITSATAASAWNAPPLTWKSRRPRYRSSRRSGVQIHPTLAELSNAPVCRA